MKNKTIVKIASLSLLGVLTLGSAVIALKHSGTLYEANAATLPNKIDLNDSTESEIKDYYSSLSSLSEEERSGTNLLKNLKGIIANNVTYFS